MFSSGKPQKGSHKIFSSPRLSDDDRGVIRVDQNAGPLIVSKIPTLRYESVFKQKRDEYNQKIEEIKAKRAENKDKENEEEKQQDTNCNIM